MPAANLLAAPAAGFPPGQLWSKDRPAGLKHHRSEERIGPAAGGPLQLASGFSLAQLRLATHNCVLDALPLLSGVGRLSFFQPIRSFTA